VALSCVAHILYRPYKLLIQEPPSDYLLPKCHAVALLHDFHSFEIIIIVDNDVEMRDDQPAAPDSDDVTNAKAQLKKAQEKQKDQQLIKNIKAKINFNCFITQRKPDERLTGGIDALHKKMAEAVKNSISCSSMKMYNKYYMGKICLEISKNEKDYYKRFEIDIGKKYGQRYCKSLIAFYKLCLDYPAVKYCGVGYRVFHGHIDKIRSLIFVDNDDAFWRRE